MYGCLCFLLFVVVVVCHYRYYIHYIVDDGCSECGKILREFKNLKKKYQLPQTIKINTQFENQQQKNTT